MSFNNTLVIGMSATALFDLNEADQLWKKHQVNPETAIRNYRQHMLERENDDLADGTGMPLVRALLTLNQYSDEDNPLVDVVVMSRNSPETGMRVLNNIRRHHIAISRYAFTGGESVTDYLNAYGVDLFLTTSSEDAQHVIDSGQCATAIVKAPPPTPTAPSPQQVRIAFDGDAVIFDDSSENIYQQEGLAKFHDNENQKQDIPMPDGPYAHFLKKLSRLQERLPFRVELSPVRIAIVTARSAPAEMRVIKTLRQWNVYIDEIFFLGGLDKSHVLQAFKPHIFFDDQDRHLTTTAQHVPAGQVPYASHSPLKQRAKMK